MKYQPPANENYAATIVRIRSVLPLSGCDNAVGVPMLGFQAITQKGIAVGELRILFTAETQLSEEYARMNNLHRHGDRNDDEAQKGYLEDNRRVKAVKFRGHTSSALLMPLESLRYLGYKPEDFSEGDVFDKLGDHEICKKYLIKTHTPRTGNVPTPKVRRVEEKFFPGHFDTSNFWRNLDRFRDDDTVVVTQKLHGTSLRVGRTTVNRQLPWRDKLAKKFGVKVQETDTDYIFGSRNVVKDPNNPGQTHFYSTDLYTQHGKKIEGLLPAGFILYGELIGWVEGRSPIQKNYTYNVPEGTAEFYVYRVAQINSEGLSTDLGWRQLKEFCGNLGLKHVPEVSINNFRQALDTNFIEQLMNRRLHDIGFSSCLQLSDLSSVDEGVCIRRDGLTPLILKAKSPKFLEHETKLLDQQISDIEAEA